MTDTVLFDLFGVIARDHAPTAMDRLAATAGAAVPDLHEAYWAMRPPYDRGELTGPDYWNRVADTLGTHFDDRRIAALIADDIAGWSAVDDDMVALIAELAAARRPIALLSNIPEELAAHYEEHHPWLKQFTVCAFSCRIGHAKPEPDAYRWCLQALALEPHRILFVDDREENIQAAGALGIPGHLFTGAARLRDALSELI